MLVFVNLTEDGNINELYSFRNKKQLEVNPLDNSFIDISNNPRIQEIVGTPEKFVFLSENEIFIDKPIVELDVNKFKIIPDGVDTAIVTVHNLPDWVTEVKLRVNEQEVMLADSEPLEITADDDMTISVTVDDKMVMCYDSIQILAAIEYE